MNILTTSLPPPIQTPNSNPQIMPNDCTCDGLQTAVKQELKKANAAAAITQMSVAGMGGEEQGAAARGTPEGDGTGTAARKSEKVNTQV